MRRGLIKPCKNFLLYGITVQHQHCSTLPLGETLLAKNRPMLHLCTCVVISFLSQVPLSSFQTTTESVATCTGPGHRGEGGRTLPIRSFDVIAKNQYEPNTFISYVACVKYVSIPTSIIVWLCLMSVHIYDGITTIKKIL